MWDTYGYDGYKHGCTQIIDIKLNTNVPLLLAFFAADSRLAAAQHIGGGSRAGQRGGGGLEVMCVPHWPDGRGAGIQAYYINKRHATWHMGHVDALYLLACASSPCISGL